MMSQVTAAFSASVSSGCPPLVVSFTDQSSTSSGTITSWSWDFDNTNTSVLQNPSAGFITPGNYVVTLTVTNSGGQSASATHTITVYNKPTVSLSSTPSSGCAPLAVQFSSSGSSAGSGTIQSYQWDFGDGSSFSTAQNPAHTYNTGGTFIPSLKITNSHGCHKTNAGTQISASSGPTASFTSPNPQGCAPPHTVNFNNTSTGTGLTYNWNLDVATSTATNPTQTYNAVGEYDIQLIATDASGCKDTAFQANFVKVSDVVADFSVVTPNCVDEQITITNTTTGATSYTWAWGDGTTGYGQNPFKAYSSGGTYTITLTAINGICSATQTKTIDIQQITPSFTTSTDYACEVPNTTFYTNTSTVNFGSIVYHQWRYGIYDPVLGTPIIIRSEIDTVGADSCVRDPDDLGYFDDTLIVVSDIGCTAQVVKPQNIFIEIMYAAYTAQPPG
ncbi:MAG: PKD domain-containing protein [Flavobacteriales bacterium]